MSAPVLAARIQKRLGGFTLDLAFEAGSGITVLFGPSGAGKSAALCAIAGALRPDAGRIAFEATAFFDSAARVDLKPEHRRVGWVFQDARLFPHLSVEDNLRYGLRRAVGPPRLDFKAVSEVLGLSRLLTRRPRDLSGGEAQRVALGRALLSQPRLLLMDEPLSALDAARKADILSFIETVRDAFAIPMLYVTHSLAETVRLADRLVMLDEGRVVAQGPLADLMTRADLPRLTERADAAAVVDGTVRGGQGGLSQVTAGDAVWTCPRLDQPIGASVRLVVLARDVMLATREPLGLSAGNVIAATLASLTPRPDGAVMAQLSVGGRTVLSLLTPEAVARLSLHPGLAVWVVVKAVAVERAGRSGLLS